MNSIRRWTMVLLAALALSPALAETGRVEVLSERVNLRAKPRAEAEVAGQVGRGTILEFRGTNAEWVGVASPTNIGLWVSSEFVKSNTVSIDKLNVRAGAGINYPAVALILKGETVAPRSQMGQWTEIDPPSNAVLWVSREYVKLLFETPAPAAAVPPGLSMVKEAPAPLRTPSVKPGAPGLASTAAPGEEPAAGTPPDLSERGLVPLPGQGEVMEFEGALHKTSVFDFGRISNYCLVDWARGRPVTVCYIRGNNAQLKEFEGRRLRIKGDGYWIKGSAKAVLVPRQIMPLVAP